MLISAKLAPTCSYAELERFWRLADELGFYGVWDYDHFYGPDAIGDAVARDYRKDTLEAWTTLAAMATVVKRARIGCLVTGVMYRNPAVLAKMAVTVDHISGGRLEFGLGAGWHGAEHRGYGIPFPSAGERIAILDEALRVIKALWTEDTASFDGQHFRLEDAICNPKPVQKPHPPIVVAGQGAKKSLRVVATHADEWNGTGIEPAEWTRINQVLTSHCDAIGRDPGAIRRGVQVFLHPAQERAMAETLDLLPAYEAAGCQHAVLNFYQPPTDAQLKRAAPR
jgi:F420-dependent oxidoreductase-like protein